METRLASKSDAALLAALHSESFAEGCWSLSQFESSLSLDTTQVLLAFDAKNPQGFILCQIAGDDAEILTLCVTSSSRRKGVGGLLLNEAAKLGRQKNATRLYLEVATDNPSAITLYKKSGFRIIGTRAKYYKRPTRSVAAILMALVL